jgi:hypothetical protein
VRASDGVAGRVDGSLSFNWQSGGDVRLDVRREQVGTLHKGQTPAVYPALREHVRNNSNPTTEASMLVSGGEDSDRCAFDPSPDGRRYAACGDGVVAPVAEWIARRIVAVSEGRNPDGG